MAQPIVVSIPHSLGKDEAARRLKSGLSTASGTFNLLKIEEEVWSGDRMTFRVRALGQAASGSVDVGDSLVRFEVMLPPLLHSFAEMVQKALTSRGQVLLEHKPQKPDEREPDPRA